MGNLVLQIYMLLFEHQHKTTSPDLLWAELKAFTPPGYLMCLFDIDEVDFLNGSCGVKSEFCLNPTPLQTHLKTSSESAHNSYRPVIR